MSSTSSDPAQASPSTKRKHEDTQASAPAASSAESAALAAEQATHHCPCCKRFKPASSESPAGSTPSEAVPFSLDLSAYAVLPEVLALCSELVELRRHLHQHPELSFEEVQTAAFVARYLRETARIEDVRTGVGRTGVVAVIRGGAGAGPCVALRADMDALPIVEATGLPFASENEGVHHACGHDGHMAMVLVAARVLSESRASLRGSVKIIMQPAEEGKGGAREMIKDGVLTNEPAVDEVYGLHLWNYVEPGKLSVRKGVMMAASDAWYIRIRGKGGHGAVPQGTNDAIVAAGQLITALQTVVSRNVPPLDAAVLTIGKVNGGFGYNIIADYVELQGTCRSMDKEVQALVERRMGEICAGIGATFGCSIELDYQHGYPPTVNSSPAHVDKFIASASKVIGADNILEERGTMGAEDFSYFLQERPGCWFFLGSAPFVNEEVPHHKPNFTINEDVLPLGASIFVQLVRDALAGDA